MLAQRIFGLALGHEDLNDHERLPADSPLWQMQNVILTPQVSARSDLDDEARFAIGVENLRRYVGGEDAVGGGRGEGLLAPPRRPWHWPPPVTWAALVNSAGVLGSLLA